MRFCLKKKKKTSKGRHKIKFLAPLIRIDKFITIKSIDKSKKTDHHICCLVQQRDNFEKLFLSTLELHRATRKYLLANSSYISRYISAHQAELIIL